MDGLSNGILWLITIINGSSGVIIAPVLYYYLLQFYKKKHKIYIQKRYPKLVVITNSLIICALILVSSLNSVKFVSPLISTNYTVYLLISRILNVISSPFLYTINWLILARIWLMFYDLNYANSNMNKKWKSYLDPTLIEKDFWLTNKDKYGSFHYVLKLSIVGSVVFTLFAIITVQFTITKNLDSIRIFVIGALHAIIYLILMIIYCKLPTIIDLFHLKSEVKLLIIIQIVGWILIFITNAIYKVNNNIISFIGLILRLNCGVVGYMAMAFTSTWWIVKILDNKFSKENSKQPKREKSQQLQSVLVDEKNFQLFMQHLTREMSTEIMICFIQGFIEMVQFKHLIMSKCELQTFGGIMSSITEEKEIENNEIIFFNFKQCDITKNIAIPKSQIVYSLETNEPNNYFRIAHKLYNKYIKEDVELEINISASLREIYVNKMDCDVEIFINKMIDEKLGLIDLFKYFDCIIEEMYCLLTSSLERFLEADKNINIARIQMPRLDSDQIIRNLSD
eukprot:546326_1